MRFIYGILLSLFISVNCYAINVNISSSDLAKSIVDVVQEHVLAGGVMLLIALFMIIFSAIKFFSGNGWLLIKAIIALTIIGSAAKFLPVFGMLI